MPHRVLIADDEPIIRLDLAEMLRAAGYTVAGEAADGFDAIELARQLRPDVVLMDVAMPVFDGLTAARAIIQERLAQTLLLVTSYCDEKFLSAAREIGVGGYLVKPVREKDLLPAIHIALAQSERYRAVEQREQAALRKVQDQQLIARAKSVLAADKRISEAEALALMQKASMDKRCSLALYAQKVVDAYVDDDIVRRAKQKLMRRYDLSEKAAYNRLKQQAAQAGESVYHTAKMLLSEESRP